MNDPEHAPDPGEEPRVTGVRIVTDHVTPEAAEVMARMVAALPEEFCQMMVALRQATPSGRYAIEMEDGLDRAEVTQPIADGLAAALDGMGVRHDGISVGQTAHVDPSAVA